MRISVTIPPSSVCTTWVCREGTTRPLPRLTSSRIAKCAQTRNATSMARKVISSIREVRGVRSAAAARISLAKAKSDDDIWLFDQGCSWRDIRLCGGGVRRSGRLSLQDRQDLVAWSVGDQTAVVEQQQAVDHVEKREAMGGDDDRHPFVAQCLQPFKEFAFAADVE